MKKTKMMETMAKRIGELDYMEKKTREQACLLYLKATGLHAGDISISEMVKRAIARYKICGIYHENVKFDIEYMAEQYRQHLESGYEMRNMFNLLFGMSIYAYRDKLS